MKNLKRLGTTTVALTFVLSLSAFAGQISTPPCAPPDPGIQYRICQPCAPARLFRAQQAEVELLGHQNAVLGGRTPPLPELSQD